MTQYREILCLKSLGFSERNIAQSCGVSRNTVAKVLKKAAEINLSWPLDFDMTDSALEEFMIFWLEDIMRPRITDDTYTTYKSAIKNYIVQQIGKMYMSTLNQGYIRKLYNAVAEKYESVAKNVRTIMKTSLEYAFNKNVLATNPAKGINLPKKIKKTEYRVLKIDEKKTLTLPQVLRLIEASKETPIHMQILFAVLMGLRRSEINGLKYSDVIISTGH